MDTRPPAPDDFTDLPESTQMWMQARVPALRGVRWAGYIHGFAAYRLYLQDRLPEAVEACDAALAAGSSQGGTWLADLMYTSNAELEARDNSRRAERSPFAFELPAADRRYDNLMDTAESCAARVEQALRFRRPKTMFTLLPPDSLINRTNSRAGYMVAKEPYFKICLPCPHPDWPQEAAAGLVHEYTHVAVYEVSAWKAPRWVNEGVAQWMEGEVLGPSAAEQPSLPPDDRPSLGKIEGLFHLAGLSEYAEHAPYAYDAALSAVQHLVLVHGEAKVSDFVVRLASESEGHAFGAAFGQSERQFERAWHERLEAEDER